VVVVMDGDGELDRLLGTVDDAMESTVIVLPPDQLIGAAARELEDAGVSGAPVVDGGRVVGVVTLRNLFGGAGIDVGKVATAGPWLRYESSLDRTGSRVRDVMTASVATLPMGTPLTQVALTMQERGVNRIPIVDREGELRGIVTRGDVIAAVARAARRLRQGEAQPADSRIEAG
jgi:CBS domain-containing protein